MRTRNDARGYDALRPVNIDVGVQANPEGSVLYSSGKTKVLVAASLEEGVKDWLRGKGRGWVTAEYAMHPRANPSRQRREGWGREVSGRTQEIQRLVGRALRSSVDLKALGERSVSIDCDVLDADGGTRTAAITGGWIALAMALDRLRKKGLVSRGVLREPIAAISVGYFEGHAMLDLNYDEDSKADVDLNIVATASGAIVEVQGTAEGAPLPKSAFDAMLDLGLGAIPKLIDGQKAALEAAGIPWRELVA
jgi:ribonuclease PH